MTTANFNDLVYHTKISTCSSCDTHEYRLPFPITPGIEKYISCFGSLKYPLSKIKVIKIDNTHVQIMSRVGTTTLKIKFKNDPKMRQTFETQLAAYVGQEMGIVVDV